MKNYYYLVLSVIFIIMAASTSSCTGSAAVASSWPGLSADESNAYVAYNQFVIAVNLSNGNEKWRYPQEANNKISFFAAPVLTEDGQLLVGGYDNKLRSLNPDTGQENWVFSGADNRFIASPLTNQTGIYAPTGGTNLYKLDSSGVEQWVFTTDGAQWAQPLYSEDCGCIYLTSMDHALYAIDATTGEELWRSEKFAGSIVGTPTVGLDNQLYFGTFSNELIKYDIETHQANTIFKTEGSIWSSPVLHEGRLFFGDLIGNIYAFDITSNEILWQAKPDDAVLGSPLVTDNAVYFGAESGTLFAYDLDGKQLWQSSFDGSIYASPVISGDTLLVALFTSDQLLVALDLDGNTKWQFSPAKK